ncbi:phage tail assembly protein [Aminobacterium sp. MB27-C1]|uniref:phage tail assembly protein n=1 Tax=Aminobacterium sp. MB27-C1 TaxID=3070661 RepID=UPI0027DBFEA4|nr:phage tail assembly protein [Aminobacterium sp. MB27-C1]WMI72130.1 phage tail assembly protein [Aminobacterium sp. MB27-C1]
METIKLTKPVSYAGKEYKELELDLEGLSGADMIAAEQECLVLQQVVSPVAEFSKTYLSSLAARAAKVDYEMIKQLPVRDFTYVTLVVQNFLLDTGGPREELLGA